MVRRGPVLRVVCVSGDQEVGTVVKAIGDLVLVRAT